MLHKLSLKKMTMYNAPKTFSAAKIKQADASASAC